MKYSIHSTKQDAIAEIARLDAFFGLPTLGSMTYGVAEEFEGIWRFRVKDHGPWKCDHVAANVQFIEEPVVEVQA